MYLPSSFSNQNLEQIAQVTKENSFVTFMSFDERGNPQFGHIPILLERQGDQFRLFGHMARRNPQIEHLRKNKNSQILVQGPHCYVSPRWYKSGRDVPTWNYIVIHFSGTVQLVEDYEGLTGILDKTVRHFESSFASPMEFELPDDLADPEVLLSAITGFAFTVEKIEAKFKLSQNRPKEDREGVIKGLGEQSNEPSQAVQKWMMEFRN